MESEELGLRYHWATGFEDQNNYLDILNCSGVIRKISRSKGIRTRTDRTRKGSGLGWAHTGEGTILPLLLWVSISGSGEEKGQELFPHLKFSLWGGFGGNCIASLWSWGKKEVHGLMDGNQGWSSAYSFFFGLTGTCEILGGLRMKYRLYLPCLFSTMSNLSVPRRRAVGNETMWNIWPMRHSASRILSMRCAAETTEEGSKRKRRERQGVVPRYRQQHSAPA